MIVKIEYYATSAAERLLAYFKLLEVAGCTPHVYLESIVHKKNWPCKAWTESVFRLEYTEQPRPTKSEEHKNTELIDGEVYVVL